MLPPKPQTHLVHPLHHPYIQPIHIMILGNGLIMTIITLNVFSSGANIIKCQIHRYCVGVIIRLIACILLSFYHVLSRVALTTEHEVLLYHID